MVTSRGEWAAGRSRLVAGGAAVTLAMGIGAVATHGGAAAARTASSAATATATPSPPGAPPTTSPPSPRPSPSASATSSPAATGVPGPVHRADRPALPPDSLPGATVSVNATPRSPRTAQSTTLLVRISSTYRTATNIDWGDGTQLRWFTIDDCYVWHRPQRPAPTPTPTPSPSLVPGLPSPSPTSSPTPAPSTPAPAPRQVDEEPYTHAYRYPGVYQVVVRVTSECGSPAGSDSRVQTVVVQPGPDVSNGPVAPFAGLSGDPTTAFVSGSDQDGWVSELLVDWGDGSKGSVARFAPTGCRDPQWHWPQSSQTAELHHRFATPGPHRVRVLAVSTGCDGRDPQRAMATQTF